MTMLRETDNGGRMNVREWIAVCAMLAAAILLFWWRVWIPTPDDRMYLTGDVLIKDYPTRLGLFRTLLSGHLPLWDPFQFGGWPGIANCEAGFFYPFNWLLIPFVNAPQAAFQVTEWIVLLHFFIAGLGAYRLARFMGVSSAGSVMTAVAYTFCGFHCAHKQHTNMLFALVWFPWLMLLAERWIGGRMMRFPIGLPLLLALVFLAGHPQAALYITLILTARLLFAVYERCRSERDWTPGAVVLRCLPIAGINVLAFGLAAVQWFPTMELIRQGERAAADVFSSGSEFSLPPLELLEILFPEALRHWSQVEVFYWGIVPLVLMVIALNRGTLDSRMKFWLGVTVVAVSLSLGKFLFAYDLSYVLIPGIAWVRAPSRWIYFASLPIALMAGRGVDVMMREKFDEAIHRDRSVIPKTALAIVGVLVFIVWLVFFMSDDLVRNDLLRTLIYSTVFMGAILWAVRFRQNGRLGPCAFAAVAVALTLLDLGTHFRTYDLSATTKGYALDEEIQFLHQAPWNHRTKVFFRAGGERTLYHGAAQNFYELDGQSPLSPKIHLQLREDSSLLFPAKPNLALLELCGVRSVLTDAVGLPPCFKRETQRLYTLNSPSVRARVTSEAILVDPEYQRDLVALQSFPFDCVTIVSEPRLESDELSLPENALYPKPFLLASASLESVTAGAYLIVDGENHFDDLHYDAGYFLASADPETGQIVEAQAFDLMADINNLGYPDHHRMADFIRSIPDGHVVFAAVKDNAADSLLPIGLNALRQIGASVDARSKVRIAHAIVGCKGAPIGSALEVFSATEALVLQTTKTVRIEGIVAPKPVITGYATTEHHEIWKLFLKEIDDGLTRPLRYEIEPDGEGLPLSVPVQLYSSPAKMDGEPPDDRASILVAETEISTNGKGYNLAVLDPYSGNVQAVDSFNLMLDYDPAKITSETVLDATQPMSAYMAMISDASTENRRMQEFLRSAPEGAVILGAVRDDGTDLLLPETLAELRALGSALPIDYTNSETRKHIGHAFIAVKGATLCIEAFAHKRDVFAFSRYRGGPVLSHFELKLPPGETVFIPTNPMDELIENATTSEWAATTEPGTVWAATNDDPNRIRLSGMGGEGGILFISEIFYPGWTAYVDGVKRPLQRVNYYFRGIEIEAGPHEVILKYEPASFKYGAGISLLALLAVLGLFFYHKKNLAETGNA